MTLHDIIQIEDVKEYNVIWYGMGCYMNYMDDNGLLRPIIEMTKCASLDGRIYIILAGLSGVKARYMFAIRLTEEVEDQTYKWERVTLKLDMYANRLILRHEKKFSQYHNDGKRFLVDEIWPAEGNRLVEKFIDYDSVELSFEQLQEIIDNNYLDYYEHFTCVKAIYMIIDGNTGKQYIGSAYQNDESLWARWRTYSETYHGGNEKLKELYKKEGAKYFKKFKYIILQIYPMKTSDKEIIEAEAKYKERFMTRKFGLNAN